MPRTQKRWLADQGMVDPQIPIAVTSFVATTGALPITFSTSLGLIGTPTASSANVLEIPLDHLVYRSGMQDDLQEQFGGGATSQVFTSALGAAAPPATFTTPAGVSGPPPFTGVTQFTPPTSRPKGIRINSITFNYLITTNNATVNTCAVYDFVYADGVAVVANVLLASAANGLSVTASATPHVTTVALTTPAYLTALNHFPVVSWAITPGAGGVSIYGITLNGHFNFN